MKEAIEFQEERINALEGKRIIWKVPRVYIFLIKKLNRAEILILNL